jgi:hypothetical protein
MLGKSFHSYVVDRKVLALWIRSPGSPSFFRLPAWLAVCLFIRRQYSQMSFSGFVDISTGCDHKARRVLDCPEAAMRDQHSKLCAVVASSVVAEFWHPLHSMLYWVFPGLCMAESLVRGRESKDAHLINRGTSWLEHNVQTQSLIPQTFVPAPTILNPPGSPA